MEKLVKTETTTRISTLGSKIAWALAAIVAMSFLLATQAGYATSTSDKSTEDLQAEQKELNKEIQEAQSEYDTAVKRLKELDANINTLTGQIAAQQAKIEEYDALIEIKKEEIAQMEIEVADQNSALNRRLRVMYETGDQSAIAVLLGSESLVDFLANTDMIQAIHKSDTELLEELERKLDELEAAKAELEEVEAALVEEKKGLETKKAEVVAAEAEAQAIRDAALEDIERLAEESKKIQAELAARESSFEYAGGIMSWPCSGTITSEYGMRVNPVTGKYVLHAGIDIAVKTGTPVKAAAAGVVISAGWNSGGYGYLVVIDNGSNITTLYAHNSALAVSAGQAVSRGQVIAYAGSTGNSTGPHCHFEVRVKGVPQNPRSWL